MTDRQKLLFSCIDKYKSDIEEAGWWLWKHPQVGYTEWEAHNYLAEQFRALGYELVTAGNIPGFYTDIETGKPGPKVCLMGELDALDVANHPEAVNGMAHCCGHCAQGAAMLALAKAYKEPGALDGISGSIRLMLVPAEELIQIEYREQLRKDGVIRYMGGKPEFMYRGLYDGVDISIMVHANNNPNADIVALEGHNGCVAKTFTYRGKAAHAGGSPEQGINAEYAALLGLQACNNLRETFPDHDHVRFHPIMKGVKSAVNIIPDEITLESYVRGRSLKAISRENAKINRALAGAAASMGAKLTMTDRMGYAPCVDDPNLAEFAIQCCKECFGEDRAAYKNHFFSKGSTDFGSLTCVMPGVHLFCDGYTGTAHGEDYKIPDMFRLSGNSAKAMIVVTDGLLADDAAEGRRIVENFKPMYPSMKAYFEDTDKLDKDFEAVVYNEDGSVTITAK